MTNRLDLFSLMQMLTLFRRAEGEVDAERGVEALVHVVARFLGLCHQVLQHRQGLAAGPQGTRLLHVAHSQV